MMECTLWGYRTDEYLKMFDLTLDPTKRFLEFACGPSAFNQDLHHHAGEVVSCDGLFEMDKEALNHCVETSFHEVTAKLALQPTLNLKEYNDNLETLINMRQKGLQLFFADYPKGKDEGRYLGIDHAKLPFDDFSFDIALSAYHFFVNPNIGDLDSYLNILKELARVAKEVRLFPLVDCRGEPSPLLGPVLLGLQQQNYGIEVKEVPYNLQPNGNAMLRLWAQQCPLSS
ncbi:MAG: hypothetical protein H2069_03515 [Legionella sp.]|nr:hypothetical protein [Legionella sp.]